MKDPQIEISGDAGPVITAAITAVVRRVLLEERAVGADPLQPPTLSPWVRVGLHASPVFQDTWLPDPMSGESAEED